MSDTLFHAIIRREIPADIVYEDDDLIAFRDISPQAPVHVLFVPKETIATLNDLQPSQAKIVGKLVLAAAAYAKREGFAEDGYRVVIYCNGDAGQTEFQLHLHLLAGAPLGRFGTPKRRRVLRKIKRPVSPGVFSLQLRLTTSPTTATAPAASPR